jgi:hypothetical protein
MKNKKCVYKHVCEACANKCKSCELRYAPYDKRIENQLKMESRRSKYKYEDNKIELVDYDIKETK